jgi:hypothetical protein
MDCHASLSTIAIGKFIIPNADRLNGCDENAETPLAALMLANTRARHVADKTDIHPAAIGRSFNVV